MNMHGVTNSINEEKNVDFNRHEVPYVPKENLSLIITSGSIESHAFRYIVELYNYRVETHWVGSRKELIKILSGEIPTHNIVVLDCHGDEDGIIPGSGERSLGAEELSRIVHLPGRLFVNMGCETGREHIAKAFIDGGCNHYIAPTEGIRGDATLFFCMHLFYYLVQGMTLEQAVEQSRKFDKHTAFYRHYTK